MNRRALVVMAKRPSAGRTKTRLMPPFTAQEAADLYECFLRDTLALVRSLPGVTPLVAYTPPDNETESYFKLLAPGFELLPQTGAALGQRLDSVLSRCLALGFNQAAAVNSDGPTLPAATLRQAFTCLDDPGTDVVLGPCEDGGYYLIGWKRPLPRLVREVQMSTDHVLQDTLAIAAQEDLHVTLLPSWYDVDDAADLERLQADLASYPASAPHTRQFLQQFVTPSKSPKST